jgi:hypothetical protein
MTEEQQAIEEERLDDGQLAGVEAERDDPAVKITRPFDPEHIKVRTDKKTIDLILRRIDHQEMELAPEFQRRARIWDPVRKSRLIESLLLRIPLPVFYVAEERNETWVVVDGLQRLTTIYDFAKGLFALGGLEYLTHLHGKTFSALPRNMQRRIEETELVINVIEAGTPDEVMINIFKRINTAGVPLTGQEIRHALNKGPARDYLAQLAKSDAFRKATNGSVKDDRMAARECVLRFIAFRLTQPNQYLTNDLDGFLNKAMRALNVMSAEERSKWRVDFERAMEAATEIFTTDSFRKKYDDDPNARRNPISKALFEVWGVNLAQRSDSELKELYQNKDKVRSEFITLMKTDREFDEAVSYATGVPERVKKRFSAVTKLLDGVLS